MFGTRSRYGVYFTPDDKAGGGTGDGTDGTQDGKEKVEGTDGTDTNVDPLASLDEKGKAALQSAIDAAVLEATTKVTEKVKTDTIAQIEKDRKAADRKAAREKAAADGDTEAALKLEREQIEADKTEAAKTRAEAQALLDDAKKLAIVQKHKLPAGSEKRLLGSTEAEWEADAKELVKLTGSQHRTADLEGGDRGTGTSKAAQDDAAKKSIAGIMRMI